ncbi:MAG: type II secretion system F family protein [Pseudomonadota bacterium]|nr:type II secretion system F family protein [Pseudomonadota bacterium]
MEWAFEYSALGSHRQWVGGVLFARNSHAACFQLKRAGYQSVQVRLQLVRSARNLFRTQFNRRDLSRFYKVTGRRLMKGRSLETGLAAGAGFIQDDRLRQAVILMRQFILDGKREHEAMLMAGFEARHAMIIRAAWLSGKTGDVFQALGLEVEREAHLKGRLNQILKMPVFMMGFMYAFFYVALRYLFPQTLVFMQTLHAQVPFYDAGVFALSQEAGRHPGLFTVCYGLLPVLAFFLGQTGAFRAVLNRFAQARELMLKTDQSILWTGYALLHEASVAPAEIASTLGEASLHDRTRLAFYRLSRLLQGGIHLDEAVESSGFPDFIVAGIQAAEQSGSLAASLRDMARDLEEEVVLLAEQLTDLAKILSILGMGAMVLFFFLATYYPIVSVSLNNV